MKIKPIFIVIVLFAAYLAVLMKFLIFRYPSGITFEIASGNYLPLKTILYYLSGEPTWNVAIRNIGGNIAFFIPLGFLVSFFRRQPTWKFILIAAFVTSASAEITQGILRVGVVDIDDVILNILGALIGYEIFVCLKSVFFKYVYK
jgi:glycopeptide antibiotics resistance protein